MTKTKEEIEVENYLAENFPLAYLHYIEDQLPSEKDDEVKKMEKEIFNVLIKAIDEYLTENCHDIISDEIKGFLQSNKFKKLILEMLVENSNSTGG